MERVEKILMMMWHLILLFILGAIFNTSMAFITLFFRELVIFVPILTGYGIYTLFKGIKNGSLQSRSEKDSK